MHLILCAFIVISLNVFSNTKLNGYKLATKLSFNSSSKLISTESEVIIPKNNKSWIPLTKTASGMTVLGKISKVNKKNMSLEYIVLNTNESPSVIVTSASLDVKLGEKAEISMESEKNKINLATQANEVEYSSNAEDI